MRILLAGGGTAGHVFPAIALARALIDDHGANVQVVGTAVGPEARLVPDAGLAFAAIEARPLRRSLSLDAVAAPVTALRSVRSCATLVDAADVVVGLGGYASVPAVLAAWRARRPVVLHEQNAIPGLANRALSLRAHATCVSFEESRALLPRRKRVVVTGNPVREAIAGVPGSREVLAKQARAEFDLDEERRTVLITGGSQGALRLNRAAAGAAELLRDRADLQLLILTGRSHIDEVTRATEADARSRPLRTRAIAFVDRMDLAYAVADLVVGRSGATTIAEITACGLAALLVPYPYATADHQRANAASLERAGAAGVLLDADLAGDTLAHRMTELLDDPRRLGAMRERSAAWGRPEAASELARVVTAAATEVRE
jgi:UDP-N-acetylglucosamine--N-acetylmuramyl-(pentapeptide) pyrophosphoryl-undecaprenol N-acetylglucosamine transferase